VGAAFVAIAARRAFFDACVVADYDLVRAERAAAAVDDARFTASQVDASDAGAVERLVREHGATHVMNAVDPRFVMPIFEGALASGADYLDMAMSLSRPHPEHPYASTGVKLGDEQFAAAAEWEGAGAWPWSASGWSRDCPTSSPATPLTTLFGSIDELGTRDGANLTVDGYDFAPSFSIWTTIEECLNPPVIWERTAAGTPPSRSRVRRCSTSRGHRAGRVRQRRARGSAPDAALDRLPAGDLQVRPRRRVHRRPSHAAQARPRQHRSGQRQGHRGEPARCSRGLPADPATLGDKMHGKTCAGVWVTGTGKDGKPRSTYLYHVVDNEWSMREYGHQCVVWQTAVNPVVALELLARGTWSGSGVLGPEAFDAAPFLELLTAYGSPWGQREQ
jgi:hypothetical protein